MVEDEIELGPTPERLARGPVERLERAQDDAGRVSRPHRAIDILAALERRRAISPEMRQAGEDFRAMFCRAHLETLGAADLSRPMVSGRGFAEAPSWRAHSAREGVWKAIVAVGGLSSAGGSCIWHVLGLDQNLKAWAMEAGWRQDAASGILIASLGALAKYMENKSAAAGKGG